ncbi:MAG: hypothetical protein J3Q66DRAFT_445997 [Benniella sp.]|nr:MAG: hypothetical protein J3Q66DRAFT_445997 [Benniella sp.]
MRIGHLSSVDRKADTRKQSKGSRKGRPKEAGERGEEKGVCGGTGSKAERRVVQLVQVCCWSFLGCGFSVHNKQLGDRRFFCSFNGRGFVLARAWACSGTSAL